MVCHLHLVRYPSFAQSCVGGAAGAHTHTVNTVIIVILQAMKVLDPDTIAAQHLLPQDQLIKERDLPERYQLHNIDASQEVSFQIDVSILM